MPNTRQEIVVRCSGSDNVTTTIRGERASATSGPREAAQRLAEKLFGPSLVSLVDDGRTDAHAHRFVALADDDMWASCTPEGRVAFDWVIPPLNVGLAHGPRRALIQVMKGLCDVISEEGQLVLEVPGAAAAKEPEVQYMAIAAFLSDHAKRNNRKGSLGVVFSTTVVRWQP